ncbi:MULTISPECIES: hypothetical protein [Halomicrobium]|jgi:hypothetical protein|uniref:HEAT repeat domain-containing protein n=1 Tax=Halomicrobium mukohataei TaxID=57705 RepID=A0A847UCQ5_9EURY|nr:MULTISPECIES: hypothetical protein [Halomicrobium]NLV10256.1 hypothetical protein [Halomicrobium mukohataei]
MTAKSADGDQFVQENKDTLVRILKHGDDEFVRALALSALVRYGNEPMLHDVESEIERAKEEV